MSKTNTPSYQLLTAEGLYETSVIQCTDPAGHTPNLYEGTPGPSTGDITVADASFGTVTLSASGSFEVVGTVSIGTTITFTDGTTTRTLTAAAVPGVDEVDPTSDPVSEAIANAINDAANSLDDIVTACFKGSVVEVTAIPAITDSVSISTNAPSEIQILTETLVGGGQAPLNVDILLGEFTLVPGLDFQVVEDDTAGTATNLAVSVNNLAGFTATVLGSVVTVTGPASRSTRFEVVHRGPTVNFTLSPDAGVMTTAETLVGVKVL